MKLKSIFYKKIPKKSDLPENLHDTAPVFDVNKSDQTVCRYSIFWMKILNYQFIMFVSSQKYEKAVQMK